LFNYENYLRNIEKAEVHIGISLRFIFYAY